MSPAARARGRRDNGDASGEDFAILNPGGGWPTKLWGAERFGALADALLVELRPALGRHLRPRRAGAGRERRRARAVRARRCSPARRSKVFTRWRGARAVYVGGDTGPTHLAVAAGAPVVGLFGPTEWWRNGSPRAEDICVERTDIDCRADCHRRACSQLGLHGHRGRARARGGGRAAAAGVEGFARGGASVRRWRCRWRVGAGRGCSAGACRSASSARRVFIAAREAAPVDARRRRRGRARRPRDPRVGRGPHPQERASSPSPAPTRTRATRSTWEASSSGWASRSRRLRACWLFCSSAGCSRRCSWASICR